LAWDAEHTLAMSRGPDIPGVNGLVAFPRPWRPCWRSKTRATTQQLLVDSMLSPWPERGRILQAGKHETERSEAVPGLTSHGIRSLATHDKRDCWRQRGVLLTMGVDPKCEWLTVWGVVSFGVGEQRVIQASALAGQESWTLALVRGLEAPSPELRELQTKASTSVVQYSRVNRRRRREGQQVRDCRPPFCRDCPGELPLIGVFTRVSRSAAVGMLLGNERPPHSSTGVLLSVARDDAEPLQSANSNGQNCGKHAATHLRPGPRMVVLVSSQFPCIQMVNNGRHAAKRGRGFPMLPKPGVGSWELGVGMSKMGVGRQSEAQPCQ
jgi:hypothetical protein